MSYRLSLLILIVLILAIGVLFFQVIQPFVLAIFVAIVLAVLFNPLHHWLTRQFAGHDRVAALVTTLLVLLLVLLPVSATVLMAGSEVMKVANGWLQWLDDHSTNSFQETIQQVERSTIGSAIDELYSKIPASQKARIRGLASQLTEGIMTELYQKTRGMLSNVFAFAVSFAVMTLAFYYFLADRSVFVREMRHFLPLEEDEQDKLIERFQSVCRGVVLGTIAAGLVQSILAGLAFAVLDVPQVWMLVALTMFFSFIPFIGSAGVWISVAIYLMLEGRYVAATGMVIYGEALISSSDNFVRAYLIGNQARLHPLVALVTVLGAIKLIGLWGIFVGPMVAALFYSLANMVRERMLQNNQPIGSADS